ncbi:MAG TPA: hypothetical protein DC064_19410, partial [Cyanobacteria bacterium UBA9273]|nr:hypothetical protein [Cyanobacteria bacterium UBA9273]
MDKLVVLELEGDLHAQGFRATLEMQLEGSIHPIKIKGHLPPAPDLATCIQCHWQENYRSLVSPWRLEAKKIIHKGAINKRIAACQESAVQLRDRMRAWLDAETFRGIDRRLREEFHRDEAMRFLIRTEERQLHKLPWQEWDFFDRYPKAEVALSGFEFERPQKSQPTILKDKVRILAILGNSKGIDIETDRQKLAALPNAEIEFLVEPERSSLNDRLWEQPWHILFFAGHSETKGEAGHIYLNQTDSLSLSELKYGLKKAIAQGLQLAIFNSCDGLGLAHELGQLHIPQMIVMREPVPDKVAQEFLNYFLTAFANGDSLYLAVRQARERLQGLEHQFPCASWLPIICQNPLEVPPKWHSLHHQTQEPRQKRSPNAAATLPLAEVTRTLPPQNLSSSLLVGRYRIIQPLGSGGFGQTFLAEDLHLPGNPQCVVKKFKPQLTDLATLQKAQKLFDREAEVLQKLGNHDQIPRLLAHFEDNQNFYLVEEWIPGNTLDLELQDPLPESQVVALLQDILHILEFVHQHNVIHRDIKPANIIRRESDGKLVLIDFGAVKQVGQTADLENATVIGSAGYMAPEQRAGNPIFASDIYAVGMLGIRALMGRTLSSLPSGIYGELLWQNQVKVTRKLAQVLDQMVCLDAKQRYQTAQAALQALSPTKLTSLPAPTSLPSLPRRRWYTLILASMAVTGLVMGMRWLRILEFLELQAYDRLMQMRSPELIDERILVVEVTTEDIAQHQYPLEDTTLAQLFKKLEQYQPRAIGLDMHRYQPRGKGRQDFISRFAENPNLVTVCASAVSDSNYYPPPELISQKLTEQLGFSELVIDTFNDKKHSMRSDLAVGESPEDPSRTVRRQLLSYDPSLALSPSTCSTPYSLSFQLAFRFLNQEGIQPLTVNQNQEWQFGTVAFHKLPSRFGGYQHLDGQSSQIAINYRANQPGQWVTLKQVLSGQLDKNLVKDRVVLIGYTAPVARDNFETPYGQMPGIWIHAHMVSQMLSAVLDRRPLIWVLPQWEDFQWGDTLWVFVWSLVGGLLAWRLRSRLYLVLAGGAAILVLHQICLITLTHGGWMPLIPSALALCGTGSILLIYQGNPQLRENR